MNEYQIALDLVLPYIQNTIGWPKELISSYGRVPVQSGTQTKWADFVCYFNQEQRPRPWLLIEVKTPATPLGEAIPQAESYSILLGSPFFCVTDGSLYKFFITGNSQGSCIPLDGAPPNPSGNCLSASVDFFKFPARVDDNIELFIAGLQAERGFLEDTKIHANNEEMLRDIIFTRIEQLQPEELKTCIGKSVMIKPPNKNLIFQEIDANFKKVKKFLKFILEFQGDAVLNLSRLLNKSDALYLKGAGIFFITQLLAAAHQNQYVVLEENISKALQELNITDIYVKNDTANGYVYVNEICKRLYKEKMKKRLQDSNLDYGLVTVHNFLWHYYSHYRITRRWTA